MNNKNPTPGEIVILAAGGVALIASFLPFFEAGGSDASAWDAFVRPVATLIMLFALASAVLVALQKFANMNVGPILGFGFVQILIAFGFFSTILALAYLLNDPGFGGFGLGIDKGIGFWLLLLSSIASLVGAVLVSNERRSVGPGPA